MKKNKPQQKLLRIEHEWLELHVRAYLKDGLAYTIRLMDGTEIHEAVFHFDAVFEKHHFSRSVSTVRIPSGTSTAIRFKDIRSRRPRSPRH
jgi:hypothetical protein|nr:MAG TPA_asm: hypothetical protein [Caudoviricetes sp.]